MKKIISTMLALAMVLTMVTGCKKDDHDHTSCTDPAHDHATEAASTAKPTEAATEAPTEAEKIEYASVVFVSVNPRFAIYFDAEGKVVKTTAENDDGAALDMKLDTLTEKTAADALTELLDAIYEAGYFKDGENNIELTFFGEAEGVVENVANLGELEKAIYEAAKAFVEDKKIEATVTAKTSPEAAPVKLAEIENDPTKPTKPTAPTKPTEATKPTTKPTEAPTTAPTTPKPTEAPATKPTEAPKPTTPKPTTPKPTEPSHQHNYSSEVVDPTCTEGGYTKYTCACGDSYTDNKTAKLGHDLEKTVVKATYESGGYTKYTCKRCGYSYTGEETAPLPKPTEPTTKPTDPSEEPTEPEGDPDAVCPYCGGPHYLYECPVAKEDSEKPTEPDPCPYCGETDCPYPDTGDHTQCKGYDPKEDSSKYCPVCGQPTSVCERWTADMVCPRCGEEVPAWNCHHCKHR